VVATRDLQRRGCNAATFFSPSRRVAAEQTADLLDSTISARASAHASRSSTGGGLRRHAVCDNPEWINGLSNRSLSLSPQPERADRFANWWTTT